MKLNLNLNWYVIAVIPMLALIVTEGGVNFRLVQVRWSSSYFAFEAFY